MGEPIPPHLQPAYVELGYCAGAFPLTEAIHREVLSLPMGLHLNYAQQAHVLDSVLTHKDHYK